MKTSSTRKFSLPSLISAAALSLLLTACVPSIDAPGTSVEPSPNQPSSPSEPTQPDNPGTGQQGSSSAGEASLTISGDTFTFNIDTCIIQDEDVVIFGPGAHDATGMEAHIEIDFLLFDGEWEGAVRVELGTTARFESTDMFYFFDSAWNNTEAMVAVIPVMKMFEAHGVYFEQSGTRLGNGVLVVDCN